jgi:hypothetical protein
LTPEEIADRLKTPGSTFPISGTVYPKQGGVFAGEGTIRRTEDDFILHLMFRVGAEAPQPKGRTFTRDDFWRFEGVIGATLPLVVEHLAPLGTRHWNKGVTSQEYHVHTIRIDLVRLAQSPVRKVSASSASAVNLKENDDKLPESFDWEPEGVEGIGQSALSTADSGAASTTQSVMTRIAETEQSTQPSTPNEESRKRSAYATGTWIHAVVLNFPLIHTNGATDFAEKNDFLGESSRSTADTFSGAFDGVKFGLVQRDDDLNVYLFLPGGKDESIPAQVHEQFLTAFLTGLAFATGQHCWPYRVTIRQNGAQLFDKLHAVRKLDRTSLAPFSERIGFNAAVGQIEWQFADFLGQATRFFNSGSELSDAASRALWLLRASNAKNVPGEITLMSLCVLLESLAGTIFDDKKLELTQDAASFEQARAKLLEWIKENKPHDSRGFQRFQNMIASARLDRAKDKYKAVSQHFDLQWEGLMKDAWDIWEKVRNKGAHNLSPRAEPLTVIAVYAAISKDS